MADVNRITDTNGDTHDLRDATAEKTANKVTSITSSSTDTQYPSAKAVYTLFNSITNGNEVSY